LKLKLTYKKLKLVYHVTNVQLGTLQETSSGCTFVIRNTKYLKNIKQDYLTFFI